MNRNALFALALTAVLSLPALAQDEERPHGTEGETAVADGPEALSLKALQDACEPPASMAQAEKDASTKLCDAYLAGLSDGLFMRNAIIAQGMTVCLPEDGPISPGEAKADLKDFLADHPEAEDDSAGVAVTYAIIAAHPCE